MVATIQQIIGKVNPQLYAENYSDLIKKYGSTDKIPPEEVKAKSLSKHTLVYESFSESLEPVYYFLLDLMSDDFGYEVEKLVDNFSSAPGSAHFSEAGLKASKMQEEAVKYLGMANAVVRSILNVVYDLRDFKMRLQIYDDLNSKDKKNAAILSLKQLWMDKVDILKGNSSIKAMSMQGGFQTLISAFLSAKNTKDVGDLDLNEVVKRILYPRIQEFNIWVEQSEKELRKRYEIERIYLKSQVNSVKLYSRWIKPYLKVAQQLEMKDQRRNPGLVKTFNRTILELTLLGKSKINTKSKALGGELPADFANDRFLRSLKKDYYKCVLVDFNFRALPQQGVFMGRVDVTFQAYSLSKDELDKLNQELEKSDLNDVFGLIEGATTESLDQLKKEIDEFLNEKDEEEKNQEKRNRENSNPFLALIGHYNKKTKEDKKEKNKDEKKPKDIVIKPDNFIEKEHIRPIATKEAKEDAFDFFDIYKSAHSMPSYT